MSILGVEKLLEGWLNPAICSFFLKACSSFSFWANFCCRSSLFSLCWSRFRSCCSFYEFSFFLFIWLACALYGSKCLIYFYFLLTDGSSSCFTSFFFRNCSLIFKFILCTRFSYLIFLYMILMLIMISNIIKAPEIKQYEIVSRLKKNPML